MKIDAPDIAMEEVLANSYRDYHAKGLDYICLRRSPSETVKLYFFDGDVSKLPEVVNPHDHRYDFKTLCVAGCVQNICFAPHPKGERFHRFAYDTPLLGGNGFTWIGEDRLAPNRHRSYRAGYSYWMDHNEIHTIRMVENETVICLIQYEDKVGDRPTLTFTKDREPPSLSGLYNRFSADTVLAKLAALKERVPGFSLPRVV